MIPDERYCVYRHVNKTNGKQYIGLTRQLPEQRWGKNGSNYKNKCPHFWAAIQKYGWDNFDHEVVADNLTKDDACQLEKDLIRMYNTQSREHGYNTLEGGTAPSLPEDVRRKIATGLQNNQNGKGHPCSDEKKRKISEAQKGRRLTDEHKRKLSIAKRGKHHASPTEETKKKISDSHAKTPIYCVETDTVYPSIQQCARALGLWATLICKCCKGKLKSTGGYHFRYYKDDDAINA